MAGQFRYRILTDTDQTALLRERLHELEAAHFRLTTELRLAGVVGNTANEAAAGVSVQLAAMEVQAAALREWLGLKETSDA